MYLQAFVTKSSIVFSELKASILSHDETNIDEKSLLSSVSPNESSCFDDSASSKIQSSLCDEKISQNNVVLDFLDLFSDTDRLWKRKLTSITNIGRVDSLGRLKVFLKASFTQEMVDQNIAFCIFPFLI